MLYVEETYVNRTEGYRFGESGIYETAFDNPGALYRSLRDEFGRCIGKVYVDGEDGEPIHVGWVFLKRMPYSDEPESTYLQETWVTLHEKPPTVTREVHYYKLKGA